MGTRYLLRSPRILQARVGKLDARVVLERSRRASREPLDAHVFRRWRGGDGFVGVLGSSLEKAVLRHGGTSRCMDVVLARKALKYHSQQKLERSAYSAAAGRWSEVRVSMYARSKALII